MMQSLALRGLTLGAVLASLASTSTVAQQSGAQPITFQWQKDKFLPRLEVTGELVCMSPVHGLLMQGDLDPNRRMGLKAVSFTDSAAAKKLFMSQTQEIWSRAGQEFLRLQQLDAERRVHQGKGPAPEEVAANRKLLIEFYDKLLPEFRALVPAAEQPIFDQNLKKLQATGYTWDNVFQGGGICTPEKYGSVAHGMVLRGITLPDSTALKKLAFEQMKEIWNEASLGSIVLANKKGATEADKEANRKRQRELFDKLLPQLRPLVPASQQATFDQNLKALQASDYTVVVTNIPNELAPKDPTKGLSNESTVDIRVGCYSPNCVFQPMTGVPFP